MVAAGVFTFVLLNQNTSITTTTSPSTQTTTTMQSVLTVKVGNNTQEFTMVDIMNLPETSGEGGYMKSTGTIVGPFNYSGVEVKTLLEDVGELPAGYRIEVKTLDDWTSYFTQANVEGVFSGYTPDGEPLGRIESTLILAYHLNDSPLSSDVGPLRMVMLNEDGNLTDGHLWARRIVSIEVTDEVETWELQLDGVETWNMTHDTYYALASCMHHQAEMLMKET